jgi:hypothetical protein
MSAPCDKCTTKAVWICLRCPDNAHQLTMLCPEHDAAFHGANAVNEGHERIPCDLDSISPPAVAGTALFNHQLPSDICRPFQWLIARPSDLLIMLLMSVSLFSLNSSFISAPQLQLCCRSLASPVYKHTT